MSEPSRNGKCSMCRQYTEWACADCKIDTGKTVYVCATKICRTKHELARCSNRREIKGLSNVSIRKLS